MSSPQIILFDIDLTLFDSRKFKQLFSSKLIQILKTTPEQFATSTKLYYQTLQTSTDFSPTTFTNFLGQHFGFPPKDLLKVFTIPEIYIQSVFPDTILSLKKLSPNFQLGIYSQGQPEFQTQKLNLSQLTSFFIPEYTYIFPRKLETKHLLSLPPKSIIVDDKLDVIQNLTTHHFTAIWLNRDNHMSTTVQLQTTSLSQISDLITTLKESE